MPLFLETRTVAADKATGANFSLDFAKFLDVLRTRACWVYRWRIAQRDARLFSLKFGYYRFNRFSVKSSRIIYLSLIRYFEGV